MDEVAINLIMKFLCHFNILIIMSLFIWKRGNLMITHWHYHWHSFDLFHDERQNEIKKPINSRTDWRGRKIKQHFKDSRSNKSNRF